MVRTVVFGAINVGSNPTTPAILTRKARRAARSSGLLFWLVAGLFGRQMCGPVWPLELQAVEGGANGVEQQNGKGLRVAGGKDAVGVHAHGQLDAGQARGLL